MSADVKLVAVIGSGVMGSQIAAHVTNAGVPVLMLDIVPAGAEDRNVLAKGAIERLQKTGAFMHPDNAKLIEVGNTEDDLDKIKEAEWIVEAILEDPKVKSDLYKKVDAIRKPGSIVSSNTSTIPLTVLTGDQSDAFKRDFLITHFFNPVRHMRLLELVTGAATRPDGRALMADFCDRKLGKGVVPCNDTPGFIANRLGMFFLQIAVNAAIDLNLSVEEADEVCGRPMGIPRTGVFGLIDLIGLDLMPLIGQSLLRTLAQDDPYRDIYTDHPVSQKMVAAGYTGRKGKGGYYRFQKTETGKVKESVNLQTGDYAPSAAPKIPTLEAAGKSLRALCEAQDKIGRYAWRVLSETVLYAFLLVPATVESVVEVDEAMRLGYNWKFGPFELIDKIGADWAVARLREEGRDVPPLLAMAAERGGFYKVQDGQLMFLGLEGAYHGVKRAPGVLLLEDIKRAHAPVEENPSAALWDVGDGVLCLEFRSKMNALDANIFDMMQRAVTLIGDGRGAWKGLVIYNESGNFSAGANLAFIRASIEAKAWAAIEEFIAKGQAAHHALRFAPFPTVAAPMGVALGGGCEVLLHASAIQAYCECAPGLVEANVGLVPGWGGCTQTLARALAAGGESPVTRAFDAIRMAKQAGTAAEARDLGILRPTDGISMNKDRLLFDAKARVLDLAKEYHAPAPAEIVLPGPAGRAALDLVLESARQQGKLTPHDEVIAKALMTILCGDEGGLSGAVSEEKLMETERRAFLFLCQTPETLARIAAMLDTGKPLRN